MLSFCIEAFDIYHVWYPSINVLLKSEAPVKFKIKYSLSCINGSIVTPLISLLEILMYFTLLVGTGSNIWVGRLSVKSFSDNPKVNPKDIKVAAVIVIVPPPS